jgi:hypothetical protein
MILLEIHSGIRRMTSWPVNTVTGGGRRYNRTVGAVLT